MTGASYEKIPRAVPIRPLSEIETRRPEPYPPEALFGPAFLHCTDVVDDHDVVVHAVSLIAIVGVGSPALPKLRPVMVTIESVVLGEFGGLAPLMAGASYVNPPTLVPTRALTVKMLLVFNPLAMPAPLPEAHITVETEFHAVVAHMKSSNCAVRVKSMTAKFIPSSVTEAPMECGELKFLKYVTTAESNVNFAFLVPTTALTVTVDEVFLPTP
jgi:hypothetical protein